MMNKKIYLLAEYRHGAITPESLALAQEARRLSDRTGHTAAYLLLGNELSQKADQLAQQTGLDVFYLEHPDLRENHSEAFHAVLSVWLRDHPFEITFFAYSSLCCEIAPALAYTLNACSISNVINIEILNESVCCRREALYGKGIEVWRTAPGQPVIVTVITSRQKKAGPAPASAGTVHRQWVDPGKLKTKILEICPGEKYEQRLTKAPIVVAAGRGAGNEESLFYLKEITALLKDAALGASRPLCDQKWFPVGMQIGLTGQKVSPKMYLAFGISGAIQHLAGMQDSHCIVAINSDPAAPILRAAHYAVVEDLTDFLPAFLEHLRERKGLKK